MDYTPGFKTGGSISLPPAPTPMVVDHGTDGNSNKLGYSLRSLCI